MDKKINKLNKNILILNVCKCLEKWLDKDRRYVTFLWLLKWKSKLDDSKTGTRSGTRGLTVVTVFEAI